MFLRSPFCLYSGVWDDDPSNDATKRNGTLQQATGPGGVMLDSDFYSFGDTCKSVY